MFSSHLQRLGGIHLNTHNVSNNSARSANNWLPYGLNCRTIFRLTNAREEAASAMDDSVLFAKVDCDADKEFCRELGVKGYPTLQLYHRGNIIPFNGRRDKETLMSFVRDPLLPQPSPSPPAQRNRPFLHSSVAIEMNSENFDRLTSSGVWLVLFHIGSKFDREVLPAFEEASHTLQSQGVHVGVLDAIHNAAIADRFDLKGFPAFMAYVVQCSWR